MKNLNNSRRFTYFTLLVLITASCDLNLVSEDYRQVRNEKWDRENIIEIDTEINDTINPCNIFICSRIRGEYPFSNLYLFIDIYFPDGQLIRDTLNCILADESGKWLGSGFGSIWSNEIPYKSNVRFPVSGKYIFRIEQGMRQKVIPGIVDVGIRIESL